MRPSEPLALPALEGEAEPAGRDYRPIADYAFLGDGHGSALVARDGSIDWAALPRFDAEPVFSRLLDRRRGGFFQVRPAEACTVTRAYRPGTMILETRFRTARGEVLLTDALVAGPPSGQGPDRLLRRVEGLVGEVVMVARHQPLAGFATAFPALRLTPGLVDMAEGPSLATDVEFSPAGEAALARFTLAAGAARHFLLGDAASAAQELPGFQALLDEAARRWGEWSRGATYAGPWREMVERSALVLKGLTYTPTGAMVAAATTSLPEEVGGIRNWDYRFCWLRDSCLAFYALKKHGQVREAQAFLDFVLGLCRGENGRLPPLFDITGSRGMAEEEVAHFEGYRGSRPVRNGNEAAEQHQLDVYGQVLDLIHFHHSIGGAVEGALRDTAIALADLVAREWREPDAGLWEPRQPEQHYVHAALMNWVALDRAIRCLGAREHWLRERQAIEEAIRREGVHPARGHLTQVMGGEDVDAALLLAPMLGFPLDDAVLERTVDAVIARLGHGPLVYRYKTEDGLPGHEGTFLLCAFWLVDALLALGREREARERFAALVAMANDVGLYAEEIGEAGEFLGNFPQAFSHLGLIHSALVLDLYEAGGREAVRGSYADRALRETRNRLAPSLPPRHPPGGAPEA